MSDVLTTFSNIAKRFCVQAGDGERSLLHTAAKYGQVGDRAEKKELTGKRKRR